MWSRHKLEDRIEKIESPRHHPNLRLSSIVAMVNRCSSPLRNSPWTVCSQDDNGESRSMFERILSDGP